MFLPENVPNCTDLYLYFPGGNTPDFHNWEEASLIPRFLPLSTRPLSHVFKASATALCNVSAVLVIGHEYLTLDIGKLLEVGVVCRDRVRVSVRYLLLLLLLSD